MSYIINKKSLLKSRRTSLDHIRNELQYHLADRATDLPGKRIPRIARISYSSTFPEGKPARQAGGLSAMQPDVAPGFPGSLWTASLTRGLLTLPLLFPPLRKEGYATERTYHQNPNVHNQSLFFQTDDRVLRRMKDVNVTCDSLNLCCR